MKLATAGLRNPRIQPMIGAMTVGGRDERSRWWGSLVSPGPRIQGQEARSRARLIAVLTLAHLVATLVSALAGTLLALRMHGQPLLAGPLGYVLLGGTVLVATSYVLVRAGYLRAATAVYIAATAAFPLLAPFVGRPAETLDLLATAVIPLVLASTLLSQRWFMILAVSMVTCAVAELSLANLPRSEVMSGVTVLLVLFGSSVLMAVLRRHRSKIEALRAEALRVSEAALRASQSRVHALLSASRDLVLVLDEQGACKAVFGGVEAVTGYDPVTRGPFSHLENMHPEDRVQAQADLAELRVHPGQVMRREWRYQQADGTYHWYEGLLSNHLGEEGIAGIVVNVRDVTDRKAAEADRRQLQDQLQHAVKMESVGRLAGGVAHDFNNLLTAILGNADLALHGLREGVEIDEHLTGIRQAALSAATVTRQLLAFSRKHVIEARPVDVNELIQQMHTMLQRIIGEDIELRTRPGPRPLTVNVDPGLIEQGIVNLVVNARDAMPSGGDLVIETSEAVFEQPNPAARPACPAGRYVVIAISDTGTGMSDEVKRHLFEPFFTTKPRGKGTGLGLATTYAAVEQSGGSIAAESQLGHGTTFRIYLPTMAAAAERSLAQPSPTLALLPGQGVILVVEDEQRVRDTVVHTLRGCGYEVLVAANAEEALTLGIDRKEAIHLLLTDVVMPGMNGRELADMLRKIHPETHVLFTSGYGESIIAHQGALEAGIDFLGKPFTSEQLTRRVREILGRPSGPLRAVGNEPR